MCLLMKLALSEYRYSAGSAIPFGVIIADNERRGGRGRSRRRGLMAVQDEVREAVDALARSQGAPAGVYALFSFTPDDRVTRMTTTATIAG